MDIEELATMFSLFQRIFGIHLDSDDDNQCARQMMHYLHHNIPDEYQSNPLIPKVSIDELLQQNYEEYEKLSLLFFFCRLKDKDELLEQLYELDEYERQELISIFSSQNTVKHGIDLDVLRKDIDKYVTLFEMERKYQKDLNGIKNRIKEANEHSEVLIEKAEKEFRERHNSLSVSISEFHSRTNELQEVVEEIEKESVRLLESLNKISSDSMESILIQAKIDNDKIKRNIKDLKPKLQNIGLLRNQSAEFDLDVDEVRSKLEQMQTETDIVRKRIQEFNEYEKKRLRDDRQEYLELKRTKPMLIQKLTENLTELNLMKKSPHFIEVADILNSLRDRQKELMLLMAKQAQNLKQFQVTLISELDSFAK